MRKMLNIKSRKAGKRLNDPDRNPFNSPNDKRFDFLRSLSRMFTEMDTYSASSHSRVMGLTTDTSSAFHITLNGILFMHFCPGTMTTHAEPINSDLQRGLDRRLRHTQH